MQRPVCIRQCKTSRVAGALVGRKGMGVIGRTASEGSYVGRQGLLPETGAGLNLESDGTWRGVGT